MGSLILTFLLFVFYLLALIGTVGGAMSFGQATFLLAEILAPAAVLIGGAVLIDRLFSRWIKSLDN